MRTELPTQWDAHWVWPRLPDALGPRDGVVVELRTRVVLDEVPEQVVARVTADSRYVLSVNGVEVSRGPARGIPERLAFQVVDLTEHLRAGENVLTATVRYYGVATRWWQPAAPFGGLGYGGFLFEAPSIGLRSDASWRGRLAPWQPNPGDMGLREDVDGRGLRPDWHEAGFDDSDWEPVVELAVPLVGGVTAAPPGPPYGGMEPSGIPELTSDLRRGSLVADGPTGDTDTSYRTFDLGALTHGTIVLTVEAEAGTVIELSAGEDLGEDGRAVAAPRDWAGTYTASGRPGERFETLEPVGFRYVTAVAPTRASVAVDALERIYPVSTVGSFSCDDERLSATWGVGARTVQLCSMDAFVDCPGREQQSWVGDSYLHALVTMVTSSDWRLVRRNLRISAHAQRKDGFLSGISAGVGTATPVSIPEYSCYWVRALARYVERSGDLVIARELLPTATEVLAAFERHRAEDGFLRRLPGIVFVDWAQTERAEVTAAVDALYAAALLDHARLLELVLGDVAGAEDARRRQRVTATAFERLWDEDRGVYVDALDSSGPRRRVSQQTNALAVVAGCVPPERLSRVLDHVLDPARIRRTLCNADLPEPEHWRYQQWQPEGFDEEHDVVEAQPFLAHFLHEAIALAGRPELLAERCLQWWPQVEQGATTFGEFWTAKAGTASRCHGWSATPTYDLSAHVLGVRPLVETAADLGFRRAVIAPAFGRLAHVAGAVPTPHGPLRVELSTSGGQVVVPAGMTSAEVRLPGTDPVVLDGPGTHRLI
jgi:hypothetical protein